MVSSGIGHKESDLTARPALTPPYFWLRRFLQYRLPPLVVFIGVLSIPNLQDLRRRERDFFLERSWDFFLERLWDFFLERLRDFFSECLRERDFFLDLL